MKKLLLSMFVIFTFGFYAVYQRQSEVAMIFGNQTPNITTSLGVPSGDSGVVQQATPVTFTQIDEREGDYEDGNRVPNNAVVASQVQTPVPVVVPPVVPTSAITSSVAKGQYKDGTYTGNVADAYYGNIQVQVVINGGKLVDVIFLDYPRDRSTSVQINSQALPLLKQEAIQAQSANIDGVSGASATSPAFIQSLGSALALAKN